jgi:hypothetical protein
MDCAGSGAGVAKKILNTFFCRAADVIRGGGASIVRFFYQRVSEAGLERRMCAWMAGLLFCGEVRPHTACALGNGWFVFGGGPGCREANSGMDCFGNIHRGCCFVCLPRARTGLFCQAKGHIRVMDARPALCFGVVLGPRGSIDQGIEAWAQGLSGGCNDRLASVLDCECMVFQTNVCRDAGQSAELFRCYCGRTRPREIGGAFFEVEHGGGRVRANRQLITLWQFENLWQSKWPQSHRSFRRFYNRFGPIVAEQIKLPWLADMAYIAIKPVELVARSVTSTPGKKETKGK